MRSIIALDSREQFGIYTHFSGGFIPTSDNNNNKNDDYREKKRGLYYPLEMHVRESSGSQQTSKANIIIHNPVARSTCWACIILLYYIYSAVKHMLHCIKREPLFNIHFMHYYIQVYTLDAVRPTTTHDNKRQNNQNSFDGNLWYLFRLRSDYNSVNFKFHSFYI